MARKIVIEFLGDSKDLQRAMGDAEGKSTSLSGKLKSLGKTAAKGLGLGLAVAGAAFVKFGVDSVQALGRIETINAQTEAAIKSTGGAAGVTATHVEKLAGKIEGLTAQEAEAVQEGANLLLTFTKVQNKAGAGNKVFDEATKVMTDMSVAMGTDMKSSAMLVGKALNDPVKGVTALTRAGVQLTEGQKETIKTMVESGDVMGAQKIILGELETQFGGSGEAFAQTAQGQFELARHKLGEIGETIFAKLMPRLLSLTDWVLTKGLPAFEKFAGWLAANVPPVFERIRDVVSAVLGGVEGDVGGGLGRVQQIFTDVTSIITSLWDKFGDTLTDYATKTFANMKQIVGGALTIIQGIFQTFAALLKGDWSGAWDGIKTILSGAFEVLKGIVKQSLNVMGTLFEIGWTAIKGIVGAVWDGIKTIVSNGARDVVGWIADIPGKLREKIDSFRNAGAALIGGFVDGMKNAGGVIEGIAGNVWTAVRTLLNGAIDKINAALEFTISLPGKDLSINPTNIPHLAKGGIVSSPTLALIGEDGPEAVVPLGAKNRPRGGIPGMGGGSGLTVNIYGALDPMGVARQLEQILAQYQRSTGEPLNFTTVG